MFSTARGQEHAPPRASVTAAHRRMRGGGYDWITETVAGHVVTWHTGATGGFTRMLTLDRTNHRAVIILANMAGVAVHDAGMRLLVGDHP